MAAPVAPVAPVQVLLPLYQLILRQSWVPAEKAELLHAVESETVMNRGPFHQNSCCHKRSQWKRSREVGVVPDNERKQPVTASRGPGPAPELLVDGSHCYSYFNSQKLATPARMCLKPGSVVFRW